jgi:3D (Asp-Asp-Asp) domain-containing protein
VRARLRRTCAATVVITVVAAAGIPAAHGEDPAQRATDLRRENAALEAQTRSAALELYALESRLDRTRARLASLERRSASVLRRRESVDARLAAARRTLRASEGFLAHRLRTLYEEGETDPLEILLGARSLEEAIDGLDGLHFAAQQDKDIIEQTLASKRRLARLARSLRARSAELARLRSEATAQAAGLERALADRQRYIAELAVEREFKASRIASLERQVRAARERTGRLSAPGATAVIVAAPAAPPPAEGQTQDGRTMTVIATGYALPGRTATGLPVGWGVVAVDPSVIALGTRMTVPGYGEGVAADVGPAIRGAKIDLWFPSVAQALNWGVRTVTITLH